MPKAVRFNTTHYSNGTPLYEAGKAYPVSDDTMRQVVLGHAEEADVKASEIEAEQPAAASGEKVKKTKPGAEQAES